MGKTPARVPSYARPAPKTVALLNALEDGQALAHDVRALVAAARAFLKAFQEGNPDLYSSRAITDALAPFAGYRDR